MCTVHFRNMFSAFFPAAKSSRQSSLRSCLAAAANEAGNGENEKGTLFGGRKKIIALVFAVGPFAREGNWRHMKTNTGEEENAPFSRRSTEVLEWLMLYI